MIEPEGRGRGRAVVSSLLVLLAGLFLLAACQWGEQRLDQPAQPSVVAPTATPRPSATFAPSATPSPRPSATPTPPLLERLAQQPMPPRNAAILATLPAAPTPEPLTLGAQKRFWLHDVDDGADDQVRQVTARLHWLGEHVQMWVEYGVDVDDEALAASGAFFDGQIYPTNRRHFGPERSPGIDGDRRLVVLNARFRGAAGYFASANGYPRSVNPYSNEHEMFVMSIDALDPGSAPYNSVLAHEFQHMIHWSADSSEAAWLNEGASELAEDLNGFGHSEGNLRALGSDPDLQLNDWPADSGRIGAHYGASYLLLRYVLDRFGPDALRSLVQGRGHSLDGLADVLAQQPDAPSLDDLVGDWFVANALDLDEGSYGYPTLTMSIVPVGVALTHALSYEGEVHQYAADYVEVAPAAMTEELAIEFANWSTVRLVPNDAASGAYQWWSNRGDVGFSTLQRSLDLRQATTATLSFALWYDIEAGWDYGYVRASVDGGQTWRYLEGEYATDYDPNKSALGPGYTGRSGVGVTGEAPARWVYERLDLSELAGQRVLIAFDYVTDDAVNRPGLCLDDIALEVNGTRRWADDVEAGEGEWQPQGFIRHDNALPQRFMVQLVSSSDGEARVLRWYSDEDGHGSWIAPALATAPDRAYLVIAGMTPYTTEPAEYALRLSTRE